MTIQFPEMSDYKYFYRFSLKKLMCFLHKPNDSLLIIDLQNTLHMTPSVICDLLCYLKLLRQQKKCDVHIMFGKSRRLSSYLEDSMFFLHSENWSLFTTDVLSFVDSQNSLRKAINTDKINKVLIPQNPGKDLPFSVTNQIQQKIHMLFRDDKVQRMNQYGLTDPKLLSSGYIEIIENSYEHSNSSIEENCCYYTFQSYAKTGISFANSDIGMGFYQSLLNKYEKSRFEKPPRYAPLLFSLDEFIELRNSLKDRNLAGILESIVLRISDSLRVDYGFPFIFNSLILPCGGVLMIHSENVLIEIGVEFFSEFLVTNGSKLIGYRKDKLRGIVLDINVQNELINRGILRIFDYSFPGVHMAVQIGRRTN